jgi:AraC family transcriptional regulator
MTRLVLALANALKVKKAEAHSLGARLVELIDETIHEKISEPIDVSMLSAMVGLSRSHFSRAFHSTVGTPPHAHVRRLRLARAMRLMRESDDSLSEIALATGFSDQAHFSNTFRRMAGTTPSRWRTAHRQTALTTRAGSPAGRPAPTSSPPALRN